MSMRQRGDRLAHRRQPLGLDHRRVVRGVFDGEGGLVADRDHQLEVIVGELVRLPAVGNSLPWLGVGVDVDRRRRRRSGPASGRRSPRGPPA